jgi:endonuclease/exonuclease/phosphatase (EEP) superfamily protein YafD
MRLRIVQCSENHLDQCARHRLLGAADEPFTDWVAGDLVAFAVDGELAALARVRGLPYEERRRLWPDAIYPYRVPVEFQRQLAASERPALAAPALRQLLGQAWGDGAAAAIAAAIEARRPLTGDFAERLVALLQEGASMQQEQPAALAADVPPATVADPQPVVSTASPVLRNCQRGSACGQSWDGLVKTELATVRFCTRCERAVYLCTDGETLLESLQKGRCVAIPGEL